MCLFWRRKCIFIYFGLKQLFTILLLRRTVFDPGQGLCDTCAGESSDGTGFSPRTYVFPCRYHPIIIHAHLYKAAFNKKKALFTSKLGLNFKEELINCYIWSIVLYCAETWTLRKVDKYLESFEIWCWRRMEKISWIDGVRNEEVLRSRVKLARNVLRTIERWKANWTGHILRRNCLLEHIIEGKLERRAVVTGRRKRRRKQLLNDLGETQR